MATLQRSNQPLFLGEPHLSGMILKVVDLDGIELVSRIASLILAHESIKLVPRAALRGKHIFGLITFSDEPEPSSHT